MIYLNCRHINETNDHKDYNTSRGLAPVKYSVYGFIHKDKTITFHSSPLGYVHG
jgi:hypothetical protein